MPRRLVALATAALAACLGTGGAAGVATASPLDSVNGHGSVSAAARSGTARSPWLAPLATSVAQAKAEGAIDSSRVAGSHDPVSDPMYPGHGHPEVDALHYWLDLRWDGTTLGGQSTVDLRVARATDTLHLDLAPGMAVRRVVLDGRDVPVDHTGSVLSLRTGTLARDSVHRVRISYAGRPTSVPGPSVRAGLTEVGWQTDGQRTWTTQEPYGAFTWYPVNDHPSDRAVYDARITTTNGTIGVFNGAPVTQDDSTRGSTAVRTYHLDAPAASYLITLATGHYAPDHVRLPDGRVWTTWATPEDTAARDARREEAPRAYGVLRGIVGPYPFSSLGAVLVPADISMETQTLITLGNGTNARDVLLHEMSHQWFGDLVTARTWRDLWLTEGWAMYMQSLDQQIPIDELRQGCESSVAESGQAGSPRADRFAEMNVYYCLPVSLDQIRHDVGDSEARRLAQEWPAEHARRTVDRAEFTRWLQARTGHDYAPLLARWLDHVG